MGTKQGLKRTGIERFQRISKPDKLRVVAVALMP